MLLMAEAMSGFAAINGEPDGGPLLPPIALTDEVAGLVAAGDTLVHDAACVADSFPGFVETMQALGAKMAWVE